MRCAGCGRDKAPTAFAKGQRKKTAGKRRCSACTAAPGPRAAAPTTSAGVASQQRQPAAAAGAAGSPRTPGGVGAGPRPINAGTPTPAPTTTADEAAATSALRETPAPRRCSWAACGKALGEAGGKSRCGKCKQEFYCSRGCQRKHWKEGGHRQVCEEPPCCTICLVGGEDPLPLQCGCACRGAAGLAHVACKVRAAAHQGAGWHEAWERCRTCGQLYTGAMQLGLANEIVRRTRCRAPSDQDRLLARRSLGQALLNAGQHSAAEALLRSVLRCRGGRPFAHSHPATRSAASALACAVAAQGKHAEAVRLHRAVLAATPADEQGHSATRANKAVLASSLSELGDHAAAEVILRDVKAVDERARGPGDAQALQTAGLLGHVLQRQGKHAAAEAVFRPTLELQQRVLGPGHPQTLGSAHDLAVSLREQGGHAEAERLYRSTLEECRRLYPAPPAPSHTLPARTNGPAAPLLGDQIELQGRN